MCLFLYSHLTDNLTQIIHVCHLIGTVATDSICQALFLYFYDPPSCEFCLFKVQSGLLLPTSFAAMVQLCDCSLSNKPVQIDIQKQVA